MKPLTTPQGSAPVLGAKLDLITRIQVSGNAVNVAGIMPTNVLANHVQSVVRDCSVLASAVEVMRQDADFKDAYIEHLLSGEDDDVWENTAARYARDPADLSEEELVARVEAFRRWLPRWDLSVEEFADFWSVSPDRLLQAVESQRVAGSFGEVLTGNVPTWKTLSLLNR